VSAGVGPTTTAPDRSGVPHVRARGVGKRYGHLQALVDADLDLWRGEIVALAGANGAGKSTLIKVISGLVEADEGTVEVDGVPLASGIAAARAAGIAVVHQELNLVPTASVAENILLWHLPRRAGLLNRRQMHSRAAKVLDDLGIDLPLDLTAAECTSSQQRLVMIAAALSQEAGVLILDEPTAALPPDESRHVLAIAERLRGLGKVVVFVSHRLEEVRQIADRAIVMRDGRVVEELVGEAIEVDLLIELIGGRRVAEADAAAAARAEPTDRTVLVEVRGLAGPRVRPLDLQVRAGEILGVAGLVGAGRSELLRLLAGVQQPEAGEWVVGGDQRVGYIGEARSHSVFTDFDVAGNLSLPSLGRFRRGGIFVRRRAELREAHKVMGELNVKGESNSPIWALSGGNQQKVLVGRWLMSGVKTLILDEPTVGIDVGARAEVHALLRGAAADGRGVVVAIADPKELLDLCDRIIVLTEGRVTMEAEADFEEAHVVSAFYAHSHA
jgi:ABC-type sugar transport system ATPase subunit